MLLAMSIWLGKSAFIERTEAFYMIHCSEVNVPDITVLAGLQPHLIKVTNLLNLETLCTAP